MWKDFMRMWISLRYMKIESQAFGGLRFYQSKGLAQTFFPEIEGCENEKKFEQYQRISIKEIYLLMHNMSDGGRL